ncbi:hypothetical protein V6N12_070016 [Hibiscus sabdariffa]|uniref:Uncharacterized protein n=1 Tax=Hibiscus sabdariffa TaxID=183260 RepID=A0ABR2FFU2_9ROSI
MPGTNLMMGESGVRQNGLWKVDAAKVVKGRSYRDVLLNKVAGCECMSPKEVSKGPTSHVNGGISEALPSAKNGGENVDRGVISMVVDEKEKRWWSSVIRLVGICFVSHWQPLGEDERCWIDNVKLNGRSECSPVIMHGDLGWACMEKGKTDVPNEVDIETSLMQLHNMCSLAGDLSPRVELGDVILVSEGNYQPSGPKILPNNVKNLGSMSGKALEIKSWVGWEDDKLVESMLRRLRNPICPWGIVSQLNRFSTL